MCRRSILSISFVLVLSLGGSAPAEDLNPPEFAGGNQTGAVFWEFQEDSDQPTSSAYDPPYIYSPELFDPVFGFRYYSGAWQWQQGAGINGDGAMLMDGEESLVQPVPEGDGANITQYVQITWQGPGPFGIGLEIWGGGEDWPGGVEFPDEYIAGEEGLDPIEEYDLGDGWTQSVFTATFSSQDVTFIHILCHLDVEGDYLIDQVVVDMVIHDGDEPPAGPGRVAGFQPELASNPNPADEQEDVLLDAVLSWMPGVYAGKHDVYFGTNFDDVNDATASVDPNNVYQGSQDATSYPVPKAFDYGQTYYWRIDEVNAPPDNTIYKGNVWSFTAEAFAYSVEDIVVTSSGDGGLDPAETNLINVINGSGLDEDDMHSTEPEDMWLTEGAGGAWIQFEFDKPYKLHEMLVWNYNESWESILGFGFNAVVIEYSSNGTGFTTLDTIQNLDQAPGEPTGPTTIVDFGGAVVSQVKITANSNFKSENKFGLSEVRFLYIPVRAREPEPADGSEGVLPGTALSWRAGRDAGTHDVLIGTAVDDLTLVGDDLTETDFMPELALRQTYYWQVLETDVADLAGDIWSFSTNEFLVVDDFESYNDIPAEEEGSNLIYSTWTDGFDNPSANGSTIGYVEPFQPSMESEIVHDGDQSVPLTYDNRTAGSSEVTVNPADLPVGPLWARANIRALTLYVHGSEDNIGGQLYVKVNGVKLAQAVDLAGELWQEVNIDLASFGVNLQNVTSLTIGIEGAGSSGLVYIDDIRLYPSRCIPENVPGDLTGDCIVDADDIAVIADNWLIRPLSVEYTFDSGFSDTSGNSRNGVAQNNPTVAGGILTLDGTNFVDIPLGSDNPFDGIRDFSVAMDFKAGAPSILLSSARDDEPDNHSMSLFVHDWDEPFWSEVIYDNFWIGGTAAEDDPLDGEWHTVVVTYDADSEWITVYLDGIAGEGTELNPAIPDIAADTVRIGGSLNGGYPYDEGVSDLVGDVDNVRIFNFTLTPEDVNRLPAVPTGPADLNGDGIVDQADQDIIEANMGPEKLWP